MPDVAKRTFLKEDEAAIRIATSALSEAMRELVDKYGDQTKAGARIGFAQSGVSDVMDKKGRLPRVDVLIALRRELGRSIDAILGLSSSTLETKIDLLTEQLLARPALALLPPPHPVAPSTLVDVLAANHGRWSGRTIRAAQLFPHRHGAPDKGWEAWLDELQTEILRGEPEKEDHAEDAERMAQRLEEKSRVITRKKKPRKPVPKLGK